MMNTLRKTLLTLSMLLIISISAVSGYLLAGDHMGEMSKENMDMHRDSFVEQKGIMIEFMIDHQMYKCCLKNPCGYCIEKTPGHGEGATCHCLEDIVLGEHPCGECIGEILEGHGNPLLSEYFARAIAEEVGDSHINTIKEIISEKYDIAIDDQL